MPCGDVLGKIIRIQWIIIFLTCRACDESATTCVRMEGQQQGSGEPPERQGFTPNPEIVQKLRALGASENAAIKACFYTGNFNADMAAAWLFENQDLDLDAPIEEDLLKEGSDGEEEEEEEIGGELELYKMVFVVNTELNMGVGKIAAQVAHAAVALHRIMIDDPQKFGVMMLSWEQFGETKIVLKGDNAAQLNALAQQAETRGLPNYIVQDAGRTQIASGSQTVLGIIGKQDVVDSVTGKLKLM